MGQAQKKRKINKKEVHHRKVKARNCTLRLPKFAKKGGTAKKKEKITKKVSQKGKTHQKVKKNNLLF